MNTNYHSDTDYRAHWLAWYRYLARIEMEIEEEELPPGAQRPWDLPVMLGHVIDVLITANGGELE